MTLKANREEERPMHFSVQHWISHYGYMGVAFILFIEMLGIPFPAETTLTISGFEWTKGVFSLVPLLICATVGNVLGSTVTYGIGYFLGRPVIVRFGRFVGITEEKLKRADDTFAKYRGTIVLFGKFIAGIRVLIPYLAGINKMPFILFTVYNAVSALVWSAFFIIVGRYVGVAWSHYHEAMHHYLVPIIVAAALIGGLVLTLKVRKKRKKNSR
jgi:membrane protein DedA with SNARE-associated domain